MKKYLITIIVLAFVGFAIASTLTIDIPAGDDPRIAEAFGSILNLKDASGQPRPATSAEIEGAVIQWINGQTHDYERRKNMQEFTPPPLQLLPPGTPLPMPSEGAVKAKPTATPKKK